MSGAGNKEKGVKIDGVRAVAEMLNVMDPEHREKLMNRLIAEDPKMAERISQSMFTFDDLARLEPEVMREFLKTAPRHLLTVAFRKVAAGVRDAFLENMSERGRKIFQEEVQALGPRRLSEVQAAQAELLRFASKLLQARTQR